MYIHFIIHESFEGPGAFEQWARRNHFQQSSTCLYQGDALPLNINFDLLIILGGPQSPLTTLEECSYFNVDKEIAFIKKSIEAGKAVIGVCLGAQLIGEALGATFEKSPFTEIGYFPIRVTPAAKQHDLLKHFKAVEEVGHWHNDMPGLLPSSKVLASSVGCPRQIIEYADLVYGFQCHLEFTASSISGLIEAAYDSELASVEPWIQETDKIIQTDTTTMNDLLSTFLDALIHRYQQK